MTIFNIFTLFGGLALFLFGMNTMSQSLEKTAGNSLRQILAKLTSNPFKGLLLGVAVTAIIQSSSATTVMVVGFVNSGIMQLGQAIGIIMGANVGTTITAWILSLTGLEGDSFIIQLFKPSTFTPVLALIGIALNMFSKNDRKKDIGTVLLGFAVLMFGMETMSNAVKPLSEIPEFTNILLLFENPLLGMLAGALLTAVIQSSSASVGILQALSATGAVTFGAAIPIIMGQNIGTCVTALLSAIGTSKNARRAAMVHLYFNIIGAIVVCAAFYALNSVFSFSFITESIDGFYIAVVHTAFNVLCTVILIPFTKQLEKLAIATVKDNKKTDEIELLDERLLATPVFAVERCRKLTYDMANLVRDNLLLSIALIEDYDKESDAQIEEGEAKADMYEDKLGSYLVKLSAKPLSAEDSNEVSRLLHTIGDFERISDHAVNILKAAREISEKRIVFSKQAQEELRVITDATIEIVNLAVNSFINNDIAMAMMVEPLEEVVDELKIKMKDQHVKRLQAGSCTIELGFVLSDLMTSFERVSDHCSNIAVCQIEITHSSMDIHAYLNSVKTGGNSEFLDHYRNFRDKYTLPHS